MPWFLPKNFMPREFRDADGVVDLPPLDRATGSLDRFTLDPLVVEQLLFIIGA